MSSRFANIWAFALLGLASTSPLLPAEDGGDCDFIPFTTYQRNDHALTSALDKAQVTGALRAILADGGWSPVDGCQQRCCACALTQPGSPDAFITACKGSTAPQSLLERRDPRTVTRTFYHEGNPVYYPEVAYADMTTACGYGTNTLDSCASPYRVVDVKVTRTLPNDMLFISNAKSTLWYRAGPTPPPAALGADVPAVPAFAAGAGPNEIDADQAAGRGAAIPLAPVAAAQGASVNGRPVTPATVNEALKDGPVDVPRLAGDETQPRGVDFAQARRASPAPTPAPVYIPAVAAMTTSDLTTKSACAGSDAAVEDGGAWGSARCQGENQYEG